MNALSTFLDSLLFVAACIVGWVAFPVLLAAGAVALGAYAVIAELASSMVPVPDARDDASAARETAEHVCGAP